MARKPSERNHRHAMSHELNLAPLMDIITNLMFFLLIFANAIPVVTIDAPLPKIANTADEVKLAKQTDNKLEVEVMISNSGFQLRTNSFGSQSFGRLTTGEFDYQGLHKALADIHVKKPDSKEITVSAADEVEYQIMVKVMDAARAYEPGDSGFKELPPEIKNSTEQFKFNRMFPDVSIGGV